MESWRKVWRNGFAPQLSIPALIALEAGLKGDDPRIIQGATSCPPALLCVKDWTIEGADLLGFALWFGKGLETVGELETEWAELCFNADQLIQETAGCRWFLNWFDDTPRDVMRREMLAEVALAIDAKKAARIAI